MIHDIVQVQFQYNYGTETNQTENNFLNSLTLIERGTDFQFSKFYPKYPRKSPEKE